MWISVSERLPDFDENVLWCDASGYMWTEDIGHDDTWENFQAVRARDVFGGPDDMSNPITHWMPLPDSPRDGALGGPSTQSEGPSEQRGARETGGVTTATPKTASGEARIAELEGVLRAFGTERMNCRKRINADGSLNQGPTCRSSVSAEYTAPEDYCYVCRANAALSPPK